MPYDAIVLGLGAMGSATAYHLARHGRRVLGLDANARRHHNGSSHGTSRIIREAYAEAPEYVPLVRRAYALWRDLEAQSGRSLLRVTGGLNVGPPGGEIAGGALASARLHGLPHEVLDSHKVAARFPGFELSADLMAVFEPNAGILDPDACVEAHLDLAARHGAELHHSEPVIRWAPDGEGIRVETTTATYRADRLVVTAGPWAGQALAALGLPLEVWRMYNVYFEPTRPELFSPERCPIYILDVPEGMYYGFPALPGDGLKFGRHDLGEACTPETARREVTGDEVEALRSVLDRYLPGAAGAVKRTLTCLYTLTPDRNFILDRHPKHGQVAYGCGFSGHGFKFASVIGEILADLAIDGSTMHPIDFLSASRLSLAG